jgi:hypothetical protein
MTTWNHRFISFEDTFLNDGSTYIRLCEVYYDDNETPIAYSEPSLHFDDLDGVQNFVDRIAKAASQPILNESDFSEDQNLDLDYFCDPDYDDER